MKKFTAATAKSFIKKHRAILLIKVSSDFDGMTDCVQFDRGAKFAKAASNSYGENCKNTLGISGVWFVGGSRDYFKPTYAGETLTGFSCCNCCGSWEVRLPLDLSV